jgi:hypothetical protein
VDVRRQRIWEAQRSGLRNRLRDQWRISELKVDELLAEWEAEAEARDMPRVSQGYWTAAEDWLGAHAKRNL